MPSCWLEDGNGNMIATLEYESMVRFGLVQPDGSRILSAGISNAERSANGWGRSLGQALRDLAAKHYAVEVFDQNFTGFHLAGAFAALDVGLNP